MTAVFMFPGQSSRYPEMLERVMHLSPQSSNTLVHTASEIVGRDLAKHYHPHNPDMFASNRDVQIGVFLVNHLYMQALEEAGIDAPLSLGLSLGEYNHLVHIGALDFASALRLVEARGQAYDAGPDGAMASVFPLELGELQAVVHRARDWGALDIANFNSPTQHVLSGERAALDAALAILEDEYFVECVVIEQHIPMHTWGFHPVAALFRPALERAPWQPPRKPYLPNVRGTILGSPTPQDFIEALTLHVYRPVLWSESILFVANRYADARFVEVGPRAVLHNLLTRKWLTNTRFKTDHAHDLNESFSKLLQDLHRAG
jgi:[acyl-carrier-protein] S-malonyltransferase